MDTYPFQPPYEPKFHRVRQAPTHSCFVPVPCTTSSFLPSCDLCSSQQLSLQHHKNQEMKRRIRREEEEVGKEKEEPFSFTKGDSMLPKSCCVENPKEKTRVSDSHEDPVPPSEILQVENSKELVASDLSSKNGGGGKLECCNNPESSQLEIPKEARSKGPSVEDCGREKLKRHRMEMAGRVWIPEKWGQESLLKDWTDCAAFDRSLVPKGVTLAREALMDECRRVNSGQLRIENQC